MLQFSVWHIISVKGKTSVEDNGGKVKKESLTGNKVISLVNQLIEEDPQVTTYCNADTLDISSASVFMILKNKVGYR